MVPYMGMNFPVYPPELPLIGPELPLILWGRTQGVNLKPGPAFDEILVAKNNISLIQFMKKFFNK